RGSEPERASLYRVDRGGRVTTEGHYAESVASMVLAPGAPWNTADTTVAGAMSAAPAWRGYSLDGRHNWLSRSGSDPASDTTPTLNALDAYRSFGGADATYDARGALTAVGSGETYEYDLFGSLVRVTRDGGDSEYTYH